MKTKIKFPVWFECQCKYCLDDVNGTLLWQCVNQDRTIAYNDDHQPFEAFLSYLSLADRSECRIIAAAKAERLLTDRRVMKGTL